MQIHVAQNPEKTRKAIAEGKIVRFMTRKPSKEHFCSPQQFWKQNLGSFAKAKAAADSWAMQGEMPH